jgi:hypothetical protein
MSWIALRPEAQKRFTLEAPAVCGMPAARAAARPRYAARPSPTYPSFINHFSSICSGEEEVDVHCPKKHPRSAQDRFAIAQRALSVLNRLCNRVRCP